uniref:Uncharacterized protein n=1 Tax=Hyaloperonospora arabidopsidis (strain Emoy2) TaxID=559515 RepID=M4BHV0_HYAAE
MGAVAGASAIVKGVRLDEDGKWVQWTACVEWRKFKNDVHSHTEGGRCGILAT